MSDLALQLYYNWWCWREACRELGVAPEKAENGPGPLPGEAEEERRP